MCRELRFSFNLNQRDKTMTNVIKFPKEYAITDPNPAYAKEHFGDNYQMYCDWCSQVLLEKPDGQTAKLRPVPLEEYLNA